MAHYLVKADEGYFLFGEDLKQGRLVSSSLEKTWENLRGPVPNFDGEVIMEAGATPKINGSLQPMIPANEPVMHVTTSMAGTDDLVSQLEVEMDIS